MFQERKWRLEALWLRHALTNGIEGIAPVQAFDGHSSFLVLEDVGLERWIFNHDHQILKNVKKLFLCQRVKALAFLLYCSNL